MAAEVHLEGVCKIYNQGAAEVKALDNINLMFTGGDFKAIMGPSGSGKSTLLNVLGCLDKPTAGIMRLDGIEVQDIPPAALWQIRGTKIGFIFQNHYLIESLTALENVMLPQRYAGVKRRQAQAKAVELLEKVGLGQRLHHRPSQLSGGEKARVAVARALVNDPTLILADEPTGELDSKTGQVILELLHSVRSPERICLIVTHDRAVADTCDQIITMRDGQIIEA